MTAGTGVGPRGGVPARGLSSPLLAVDCGRVVYEEALDWQHRLVAARARGDVPDVLLTLEHDPVYTAGRRADVAAHVRGTAGIRVVRIERGGDMTYHGPGQLVAYPIVELEHAKAVRPYVEALAEACVRTAAAFGVDARPEPPPRTGVWVGDRKLAAIGIKVDRRITSHGLAFNVTTALDDFGGIVPCGIPDAGVCSLASLGVDVTIAQVRERLVDHLGDTLGRRVVPAALADVGIVRAAAGS
jgi:lipoyl(octanoyl) transferase